MLTTDLRQGGTEAPAPRNEQQCFSSTPSAQPRQAPVRAGQKPTQPQQGTQPSYSWPAGLGCCPAAPTSEKPAKDQAAKGQSSKFRQMGAAWAGLGHVELPEPSKLSVKAYLLCRGKEG